jgi:hypothetical protein
MTADAASSVERGRDPPTNERDEFVCARRCPDETPCRRTVPVPYLSCYQHDRSDPIARSAPGGDRIRVVREER